MIMESKRLFVGNLPPGISENDLKNEFNAYGNVQNVELKFKENLVDPTNPSYFAFIILDANGSQINQCIDEFRKEQYRGRYLTVSIARESFLDRLKREREDAQIKSRPDSFNLLVNKPDESPIVKKESPLKKINAISNSSSSSESESENSFSSEPEQNLSKKRKIDDNNESEEFITKKHAINSVHNGKIKIQTNLSQVPIHIINKKVKNVQNNLDDKKKVADKKRKESMHKMKDQYTKQKLAIQKSLTAVDSNKPKKIIFDDGNEISTTDESKSEKSKKISLFNEEEEEEDLNNYESDFVIKEQFQGIAGQKLMKLQSKFQLDSRFKMDKNFINDEHEIENDIDKNNSIKNDIHTSDNDDERKWQLNIIEQVVGHKFESLSAINRKKLQKTMLRYDPTIVDHEKFLKTIKNVSKSITTNTKKSEINEKADIVDVSKEQFFKINEDLTNCLKRRGDGFSLLSMFGRHKDDNEIKNIDNNEKILINSKLSTENNPFKFDSSDSEDEDTLKNCNNLKKKTNEIDISKGGQTTKSGVWTENFFYSNEDPRFIDGAEFFKSVKRRNVDEQTEDYDKIKNKLKNIMNKKIHKTKKNLKINNKFIKKKNFKSKK